MLKALGHEKIISVDIDAREAWRWRKKEGAAVTLDSRDPEAG